MIVKLIQVDDPISLGNALHTKGLEGYLIDINKGEGTYTYLYDTSSEEAEVEPNQLFSISVKTVSENTDDLKSIFKFYVCELSEIEKTCLMWPLAGYCFGDFKVLFETEGARVTERLQKWWKRTKEPSVELAKAITLDQQLRDELN